MKKEDELIIRYLDQNLSEEEIQILDQSTLDNTLQHVLIMMRGSFTLPLFYYK